MDRIENRTEEQTQLIEGAERGTGRGTGALAGFAKFVLDASGRSSFSPGHINGGARLEVPFYLDGVPDHCGVNSIELLRDQGGWKITQLSDTRRDGPHCPDLLSTASASADRAKM